MLIFINMNAFLFEGTMVPCQALLKAIKQYFLLKFIVMGSFYT